MEQPSDHSFDRAFREKMQGVERMPSELPWIGISAALDAMRRKRRKRWLLGMASLLLLLALPFIYNSFSQKNKAVAERQSMDPFTGLPVRALPAVTGTPQAHGMRSPGQRKTLSSLIPEKLSTGSSPKARERGSGRRIAGANAPASGSRVYSSSGDAGPDRHAPSAGIPPQRGLPGYLSGIHPSVIDRDELIFPEQKSFILPDGSLDPLSFRMLRIGFIGMAQSTFLSGSGISLYQADVAGRKQLKVRAAYGLSGAFDFSRSFGVEVNLLISSSEGQAFRSKGKKSDLRSNYIRVPVMLKYRFLRAGSLHGLPEAFCLKAGIEYGRLNWVNMDEFSGYLQPAQFNPSEFRTVADLSYEKYLSPQHILTGGVRARLGSFGRAGSEVVNSTTLAFYLQLHYGFGKRKR